MTTASTSETAIPSQQPTHGTPTNNDTDPPLSPSMDCASQQPTEQHRHYKDLTDGEAYSGDPRRDQQLPTMLHFNPQRVQTMITTGAVNDTGLHHHAQWAVRYNEVFVPDTLLDWMGCTRAIIVGTVITNLWIMPTPSSNDNGMDNIQYILTYIGRTRMQIVQSEIPAIALGRDDCQRFKMEQTKNQNTTRIPAASAVQHGNIKPVTPTVTTSSTLQSTTADTTTSSRQTNSYDQQIHRTPTHMSRMYIHTHAHIHKYLRSCGRESQGEGEGEGMRSRDHGRRRGRGHAVDRVGERIRESLESLRSRERG